MENQLVRYARLRAQDRATSLRPTLERLWPVDDAPDFAGLIIALDVADGELRRDAADELKA